MAFDKFLIAPINSGLQTNLKPFLIPDDAYQRLRNAYVFRGRTRKRWGAMPMFSESAVQNEFNKSARLRVNMGVTTDPVTGNLPATSLPNLLNIETGQMFSAGDAIFVVNSALSGPTLSNYTDITGAVVQAAPDTFAITGNGVDNLGVPVYWYPSKPVLGFANFSFDRASNQDSYAFDPYYAYKFVPATGWERSGTGAAPLWHGSELNYFWSSVFRSLTLPGASLLFVSNFYAVNPNGAISVNDDPIWYLDSGTGTWTSFSPAVLDSGEAILTARIIVPFHNRLVLLNTIEIDAAGANNVAYPFRCRFSQIENVISANAFKEPGQTGYGGGDYLDLPSQETIITASFIKDRLIVYCDRSVWELAYTGNEVQPFRWQQLNTELGAESTFSVISFDKNILAIGGTGVHSCNGSNVARIDDKIPDLIFNIRDRATSTNRIFGIRDYFNELAYWSFPEDRSQAGNQYPNRILVYNYINETWAVFDDSITAFGYFEQQLSLTWNSTPETWESYIGTWASGVQDQPRQVIAGNQEGYTFIVRADIARNASALQLTDITIVAATQVVTMTVYNHNFAVGEYLVIENALGLKTVPLNPDEIIDLDNVNQYVLQVLSVTTNTITAIAPYQYLFSGEPSLPALSTVTYAGGGVITRLSQIDILSKQWNPYDKNGSNVYIGKIDFNVDKTDYGKIKVDYLPSSAYISMTQGAQATGAALGTSVLETYPYNTALYPFEQYQTRLWHPVYFQAFGNCIQIRMYLDDAQMRDKNVVWSEFELNALIIHTKPCTRIQ